jgi:hypothetical protein
MAYDNGGVNRDRPESMTITELDAVLALPHPPMDLDAVSLWLMGLSEEHLVTAVAGEESEVEELMQQAPQGTNNLLNAIFDGEWS